ncbi:MAG TPA: hypothetical protein VIB79_31310 [Candidatus Binatia bacterium]
MLRTASALQLEPFAGEVFSLIGKTRDVPARPRQTRDKAALNRIAHSGDDDRYRFCPLLERPGSGVALRNDHVHFEVDQFGRKRWQPIGHPFRPAVIDRNVSALRIAEVPQPLSEGFYERLAR